MKNRRLYEAASCFHMSDEVGKVFRGSAKDALLSPEEEEARAAGGEDAEQKQHGTGIAGTGHGGEEFFIAPETLEGEDIILNIERKEQVHFHINTVVAFGNADHGLGGDKLYFLIGRVVLYLRGEQIRILSEILRTLHVHSELLDTFAQFQIREGIVIAAIRDQLDFTRLERTGNAAGNKRIAQSILDDDDEIVIPEPFYPNYSTMVHTCGGTIRPVPTCPEEGYGERALETDRPRKTD